MNHLTGPAVVIDDGGIPSLVVCCLATEPSRLTPYAAPARGPGAKGQTAAVARRADLLGLAQPVVRVLPPVPADAPPPDPFAEATTLLLDAGREALRLGIARVLWPVHLGTDLEAMERELDRARLVERLLSLDAPGGPAADPLRIETPLLDLTDAQVAALAADLDAPLDAAWWCRKDGPAPCGRCGPCRRWESVLSPAGRS